MSIGMMILSCFVYLIGGALLFCLGVGIVCVIMCLLREKLIDDSITDVHHGEERPTLWMEMD